MTRWEYHTTFVTAEMSKILAQMEATIPEGKHPKYSPYALIPELNGLGEKGWELVHMEPVIIGKNHDVLIHENHVNNWTNTYFCVFKRAV